MFTSISHISKGIRTGELSPVELLRTCLANVDRYESQVQAWVFIDVDLALSQAEELTAELKRGLYRGPLHGIPVGIKDIFDVFDWPTAAGSKLWAQSIARADAVIVERLRQAGVILMGKTVTTQYASFDPSPTKNPWDLERTPGGSSSGSAAAVACGMCLASLGSQTGGSITRPASYCGVASVKPTYGRVNKDGVVPLAPSMDHIGSMATCVDDLALVFNAIADSVVTEPSLANPSTSEAAPRLGLAGGLFEEKADAQVKTMMHATMAQLKAQGVTFVNLALPTSFAEVLPRHRKVMAVEAAVFHQARLRRHPEDYLPNITALLQEGISCPAPEYARCKEHQAQLGKEMDELLKSVDALLIPATTCPAPSAETTGDPAFNSPWSYTGLPSVSFLAGWSDEGLPLAVPLFGRRFEDEKLLAIAARCEAALGCERREPPLI
ncbi:MAG TPA: amidase [Gemmataceae bacterium]|nr:amidase [Gemmataceae bacterium]